MTRLLVICSVSFSRTSVLVIIRRLAVLEDVFVLAEREICQPLLGLKTTKHGFEMFSVLTLYFILFATGFTILVINMLYELI